MNTVVVSFRNLAAAATTLVASSSWGAELALPKLSTLHGIGADEAVCRAPINGVDFPRCSPQEALATSFSTIVFNGNVGLERVAIPGMKSSEIEKISVAQALLYSQSGYAVVILGGEKCPKSLEHSHWYGKLADALPGTPVMYGFNCTPWLALKFFQPRQNEFKNVIPFADPNCRLGNLFGVSEKQPVFANTFVVLKRTKNPDGSSGLEVVKPPAEITKDSPIAGSANPFTKQSFEHTVEQITGKKVLFSIPVKEPSVGCAINACGHASGSSK